MMALCPLFCAEYVGNAIKKINNKLQKNRNSLSGDTFGSQGGGGSKKAKKVRVIIRVTVLRYLQRGKKS